jgi:hypothetical protein
MNSRLRSIACWLLVAVALICTPRLASAGQHKSDAWQQKLQKDTAEAFRIPQFKLVGKLSKIFSVSRCEYISGLTCHIHYNGKLPLPSEVFFTEFDEHGKKAGPRVRLIYPELKPGETGVATFRIRLGRPAKIVLEGEWNGPWRNPY